MIVSNQGAVTIEGEILDIRSEFASMTRELLEKYEQEFGEKAKEMLQEDFKAGFMSHDELVAALIDKVFETATAFAINDDNSEDLLDSVIDNLVSKVVEQVKKDILCSES